MELAAFSPDIDYARDVYLGPVFGHIRERLHSGEMPFPDYCNNCFCLQAQLPFDEFKHLKERSVEVFQIEPSMGCQLECPGCIPLVERKGKVRKTDHGHMTLGTDVLYKIVDDFARAGVSIQKFDMQGHGEPLLNKRIWDMCRYIADRFPHSILSICTHANATFTPEMLHSGVNEMIFAIDGVDQSSYAPYRINGDFDRAYAFMTQFSHMADNVAPHIRRIWKFVILEHNDTDEQLLRAQQLALDARVEIRFVLTQLGPSSSRVVDVDQIPILPHGPTVTIDNYRIKLVQLRSGLERLRRAIWTLNRAEATTWAEYLANSIHRLFRTASMVPQSYREIIDEYRQLVASLPANYFGRYDMLVEQTLAPRRPRAEIFTNLAARIKHTPPRPAPRQAWAMTVEQCREVLRTIEVDEAWYLKTYPDIAQAKHEGAKWTPKEHFQLWGYYEDRLPYLPYVDEGFYFQTYPDVYDAFQAGRIPNASSHFIYSGYKEGRQPCPPENAEPPN